MPCALQTLGMVYEVESAKPIDFSLKLTGSININLEGGCMCLCGWW